MKAQVTRFLAGRCTADANQLNVTLFPIGGGLESTVARAKVSTRGQRLPLPRNFVIKELRGVQRRETAIYQELWLAGARPPAARILGSDCVGDSHYLYLEEIRSRSPWPWADTATAAAVCRVLARLHHPAAPTAGVFSDWDYESELARSAADTLAVALAAKNRSGVRYWRRIGDLRRVVAALPLLRSQLLAGGVTLIHGDMHPGNVIVRQRGRSNQVVLVDWARARLGSPLEDVASWLHSLGCWEHEARRRHDTLLRVYLQARAMQPALTPEFRRQYWSASASNGLSGAIRYHLAVSADPASTAEMRATSLRALPAWERVIRRTAVMLPPVFLIKRND